MYFYALSQRWVEAGNVCIETRVRSTLLNLPSVCIQAEKGSRQL